MVESLFPLIQEHGLWLLFVVLVAGIIGFPIPDEAVLVFAGVLVVKGLMALIPTFLVSLAAVWVGSLFNYWIASRLGTLKLMRLAKRWRFPVRRYKRPIRWLRRYGFWSIPFSYFIPGVRIGISYGAGLLRFPLHSFLVSSALGAVAWVSLYVLAGGWAGSYM
ncbi:DedA family protein [Brevibacillus dissolubilis]|uniref:DedA family protein n=1 Tax=Brevibacillus dissolubilis TaxID=1844116 RepID=UPI00159BB136|nr:DedA family protein [Brevibacillus dissolubilis]